MTNTERDLLLLLTKLVCAIVEPLADKVLLARVATLELEVKQTAASALK